MDYYNEFDKYPAQWLRNMYPKAVIDERTMLDVNPNELTIFTQCHFFAGIGGWSHALRLAGWPEDRPVWTGSCPCQPFSNAGKGRGIEDPRHLWPVFRWLIAQCRPPVVFGEQVASKAGRQWLHGVRADMEALGYRFAAADLCAAGVGAPHIRQRLFWVADAGLFGGGHTTERQGRENDHGLREECSRLGFTNSQRSQQGKQTGKAARQGSSIEPASGDSRVANAGLLRPQECQEQTTGSKQCGSWDDFYLIPCADGKQRRVKSGICPLAHGVPARVGALKAYGNAIVPAIAAEFVKAFMEI